MVRTSHQSHFLHNTIVKVFTFAFSEYIEKHVAHHCYSHTVASWGCTTW